MDVTMTPQQYEQVLASKEFADKFNELTKGWKPEIEKWSKNHDSRLRKILLSMQFSVLNMPIDSYKEICTLDIREMEWGLQQKVCHLLLAQAPNTNDLKSWIEIIEPIYYILQEIETYIGKQQKAAIQSAFLQLKARRELLKA